MVRISGLAKSMAHASAVPQPPMPIFDLSADATFSAVQKGMTVGQTLSIGGAERPSNMWYKSSNLSNHWYMYAIMDWYVSEVSVLSTIIMRACIELTRYGFLLKPKFAFKCEDCGHESQFFIQKCSRCGSKRLRRPDESQKKYFTRPDGKSFLDYANERHSLEDVLFSYAMSEYQNNQAYLLCVTGDIIDEEGHLHKQVPLEFMVQDPKFVKQLFDDKGKLGATYGFTFKDRGTMFALDETPDALNAFTAEGDEIQFAAYQIGSNYGGTGEFLLYTIDEIYQDQWFRPSMTYGVPHWFDIEDDLLAWHYLEKHTLNKYKKGYVRKILILPGFNEDDAEAISQDISAVLAKNTNTIPIVCMPPVAPGVPKMDAQVLDLGVESGQDALAAKNEIRERLCAHGCLPNIFAGDVESSGGMNNESQQITIFDRYLLKMYNKLDRACAWILSKFPMITDWELVSGRPSKAYTDTRKMIDNIQVAQGMKQLDIPYEFIDGEFRFGEKPFDQIMREAELRSQGLLNPEDNMMPMSHGMMVGGAVPGDGEGPPEKGTARREDGDIDSNKNDIEQSMREADSAAQV